MPLDDKSKTVIDLLGLDREDDDEEHPRRFLKIPATGEVLVYGGDSGAMVKVNDDDKPTTTLIRHWDEDDDVRAVAISDDSKFIALGFDSGNILIYRYSTDEIDGCNNTNSHPFVATKPSRSHETVGPVFEASVRDLQFCNNDQMLAVATEEGGCLLDIDTFTRHLEEEMSKQHDGSGIRGLIVMDSININNGNILASLAMDGRLCFWNTESLTLIKREKGYCVTKKDIGELLGADAWDRSCRPHLVVDNTKQHDSSSSCLILPGETYLQCRKITTKGDGNKVSVKEYDLPTDTPVHVESIVAVASKGDYLISSGRDKRVVLWKMKTEKDGTFQAKFIQQIDELESAPTDLLWEEAKGDERLRIACGNGQLFTIVGRENLVPVAQKESQKSSNFAAAGESLSTEKNKSPLKAAVEDLVNNDDSSDGGADEIEKKDIPAATKATITKKKSPMNTSLDDLDRDDDDDDDMSGGESTKNASTSAKQTTSSAATTATSPSKSRLQKPPATQADSSDDEDFGGQDDDDEDSPTQKKNRFVDDEAADSDDADSVSPRPPPPAQADASPSPAAKPATSAPLQESLAKDDDASEDDDFDMPDTDPIFTGTTTSTTFGDASTYHHHQPVMELPEPQPAFAPSSSPLDLPRRFLCWNHIGAATLRADGDNRSTVDINFTDSGFRRPISFTDNLGFILGSLGDDGGIFATDVADEDDEDGGGADDLLDGTVPGLSEKTRALVKRSQRNTKDPSKPTGSSVYFHRFETFGSLRDKDWYLTLPSGERALGCATGEGWAAVMTSRRFLRLFSSGGNQGQVIWLDGEPITLVGRSRFVGVFYHQGEPLRDGTQKIGYKLIDAVANRVITTGSVSCVSAGATLTWAGFSNDGSLLAMDSEGMLSMLVNTDPSSENAMDAIWEWMPMLDTLGLRKSSEDSHWPVTVYDGKLVCVPLKGGTKYPDAARRPVTSTIGMRLPLARGTLAKGNALEELSVRANIALAQKKVYQDLTAEGEDDEEFDREYHALSAQVDKVTLRMFAVTVEAGKMERALDLVERLHLEKSFDLAMALADNHRKLVDFIEDKKERKFGGLEEDEEEEDDDDVDEGESDDETPPEYTHDEPPSRPRISPDSSVVRKGNKRASFEGNAAPRHVRQKQAYA